MIIKKALVISISLLITSIFIALITFVVLEQLDDAKYLIKECQERGYYGVKFEKVNLLRDKLVCANQTLEEEIMEAKS